MVKIQSCKKGHLARILFLFGSGINRIFVAARWKKVPLSAALLVREDTRLSVLPSEPSAKNHTVGYQ